MGEQIKLNNRNWTKIPCAVNDLFYIKSKTNDEALGVACQTLIDILFEKYPGLLPMPSKLLAEQSSSVMDETSIAMFA